MDGGPSIVARDTESEADRSELIAYDPRSAEEVVTPWSRREALREDLRRDPAWDDDGEGGSAYTFDTAA